MKRLNEPNVIGLKAIQHEFNHYQNHAFCERPANFFSLELCGEAGELANLEKKIWRDPSNQTPFETIPDEAADVFIALMNYCNSRNINLEEAVKLKLQKIEEKRLKGLMGKTK
ncbi:MazG nucleotide pyrophosphohydrolase domain-containing protein [Pigmentibacter sp. JX0631]|uniref:MazG nucleotide pyrophosphohydrolase domain-containing protein n=1 Tax=Pigmentibacter sp. JX0631 TaxID=2976982 RepID=UPI0024699471|nr:MazG nucleotide pyrophosphohydrolase domain-containing protein [Pigmentibacter sp. JX0631]WGL59351.1 MazG nucleotide pyrophosphohydrolase domain-containing protein [Pigmentibacter sp. JX0631]